MVKRVLSRVEVREKSLNRISVTLRERGMLGSGPVDMGYMGVGFG